MTEGTQWGTTPQEESTLQQMAKKEMTESTDAVWDMPEGAQGPSNTSGTPEDMQEHTHQLIEDKINERVSEMTEETDSGGDIHQHIERRMNQMAKEMFEED